MTETQRIAEAVFGRHAAHLRLRPSWSTVDLVWRYGTPDAAAAVLKAAADHIYHRQDNGNPGNYQAVDILDGLREQLAR